VPGGEDSVYVYDAEREAAILEGAFQGPPGYEGVNGSMTAHLWIVSTRPEHAGDTESCFEPVPAGRTIVRGSSARWIECPDGSELHSGHVLLRWIEGGVSYAVSLHGRNGTKPASSPGGRRRSHRCCRAVV